MSGWVTNYLTGHDSMGNPIVIPMNLPAGTTIGGAVPYGAKKAPLQTTQTTISDTALALQSLSDLHNSLLVNGQLISTGTGDDMVSPLPTSTIKKPWLDAPDGAVPFDPQTSVALPVVGGFATVVTLTVPQGYDGVINQYSWNFTGGGFVQGSGDLQAQVFRDTSAVRNYDNILVEKGTIGIARAISPLRIYSGQVITVRINHIANNLLSGNVIASLVGYFYPSAS